MTDIKELTINALHAYIPPRLAVKSSQPQCILCKFTPLKRNNKVFANVFILIVILLLENNSDFIYE
jgi:hypothetical protein